jgi:hypothetical protein
MKPRYEISFEIRDFLILILITPSLFIGVRFGSRRPGCQGKCILAETLPGKERLGGIVSMLVGPIRQTLIKPTEIATIPRRRF